MIQTCDWIFDARVSIFFLCNAAKESAMAKQQGAMQEVRVPDLLAALTAYGLGGPRELPHADQGPSGFPAVRRSWLARCLERRFTRDDAAPGSSDLDHEWAGGSYARSRRLLDTALHAARQHKGVS
jgi:hypothetical protein